MLLSSLNRLYYYIGDKDGSLTTPSDNTTIGPRNKRVLQTWLTAISNRIENYLDRAIESTSRTEYFPTSYNRLTYYPKATPISTITSVKVDSTEAFSGSETTLTSGTQYNLGPDSNSVVLRSPEVYERQRGLQIVYTGGLAAHAVNSTLTVTGSTGTWTVDNYIVGGTSGAIGRVDTVSITDGAGTIVAEVIEGIFSDGETVTMYDDVWGVTASDPAATATFSSHSVKCLAEAYPEIVVACEMQIRHHWQHKMDFENSETTPEGNTVRHTLGNKYQLQPEVKAMLQGHKRVVIPTAVY